MEKSLNMQELDNIPNIDDDIEVVEETSEQSKSANEQTRKANECLWGDMDNTYPGENYPNQNDDTPDEQEEKARLISQVLELQNTLDDLHQRVDGVKEENLKLKSENLVLGQYIENLMSASSVFNNI